MGRVNLVFNVDDRALIDLLANHFEKVIGESLFIEVTKVENTGDEAKVVSKVALKSIVNFEDAVVLECSRSKTDTGVIDIICSFPLKGETIEENIVGGPNSTGDGSTE